MSAKQVTEHPSFRRRTKHTTAGATIHVVELLFRPQPDREHRVTVRGATRHAVFAKALLTILTYRLKS